MSHLRLIRLVAIGAPLALVFGACSSTQSSGGTSTNLEDAGGAGGRSEGMTATGSGHSVGSGQFEDAAALTCYGDQAKWEMLTSGPLPCQGDPDCCVVINPCSSDAQVVTLENNEAAIKASPYCVGQCTDCVARPIEVACIMGMCRGRVAPSEDQVGYDSPLRVDHCGGDSKLGMPMNIVGTHFDCQH